MITDPKERVVPVIPPKDQRIRLLIDADCKNEIDDQYAIALAIFTPERFAIEGFVGATFDNQWGGQDSPQKSADEIKLVLDLAGMAGRWPVLKGSDPMQYKNVPVDSEGVDFIIERAMAGTPEDPLWIVGLGAATDMACAYLKEPRIVDRVRVFWHLRTRWPEKCYNFNVFNDTRAARLLFHSPLPFVLFDTGTYLTAPMEETEVQLKPYGRLGEYMHEYRHASPHFEDPRKGFFDLGDISALVDPSIACWEETPAPEVNPDLTYSFKNTLGSILRCYHVDRDATFKMLYSAVQANCR